MVNVFSFCLYGPPNPRYYPKPMLDNIEVIHRYFPDWKVYIYAGSDVDYSFIQTLTQIPWVVLRHTGETGEINMIHRFYAIDEADIETMLVRDADSIVHWKDRWAIQCFMSQPKFLAHVIRDHVAHASAMMGGLWGLRKTAGINVHDEYSLFLKDARDLLMGKDQSFLSIAIYPKVKDKLLVNYSNNMALASEHSVGFPFQWTNDVYCGKVEYVEHKISRLPKVSIRLG